MYKQQLVQYNYFEKVVEISLTRAEWNSTDTWIQTNDSTRLGRAWFEDLQWLVMFPIIKQVSRYDDGTDYSFGIPRELLRMFVYSIGRIAYSLDVKPQTSIFAQGILEKINKQIEEQLVDDEKWKELRF